MTESLQVRIHGPPDRPTLIYFPGLHGDWTLVGSFRRALGGHVRFIDMSYPRTLTWSLDDYAAAIETALHRQSITRGWLLGESFGSQIVWAMAARGRFAAEGLVFAGGFVRHPVSWVVPQAERLIGAVPSRLMTWVTAAYGKVLRLRYRHSPEVLESVAEFIARRTELDCRAMRHRLRLISANDLRPLAEAIKLPVYMLSGLVDPVVPWSGVRPWVRRHCPALQDYRVIWRADHNVLGTAPEASAAQVLKWLGAVRAR